MMQMHGGLQASAPLRLSLGGEISVLDDSRGEEVMGRLACPDAALGL
jgi:hypothetical protein